jgi:hypothetical protein
MRQSRSRRSRKSSFAGGTEAVRKIGSFAKGSSEQPSCCSDFLSWDKCRVVVHPGQAHTRSRRGYRPSPTPRSPAMRAA